MKTEIVQRYSSPNKSHIKIECANGDSIRLEIEEYEHNGVVLNRILLTSVDTYPTVQPKASNQILINFIDR